MFQRVWYHGRRLALWSSCTVGVGLAGPSGAARVCRVWPGGVDADLDGFAVLAQAVALGIAAGVGLYVQISPIWPATWQDTTQRQNTFVAGTGNWRIDWLDFLHASASAKVLNATTNFAALLMLAATGHVWWQVGLVMAAANIAGSVLGTSLALKHGAGLVRRVWMPMCADRPYDCVGYHCGCGIYAMMRTGDSAASPLQDALRPRTAQILGHA
ncbi:conserved hypothetical protein [Ricinus communis]|uniref:Uncharacterized protein n=1 Tax=Ricinus communis TaxID=3988 RepID=B9T8T9_RICCO|nr:conserved hypothetical protein [Ricinus communis]